MPCSENIPTKGKKEEEWMAKHENDRLGFVIQVGFILLIAFLFWLFTDNNEQEKQAHDVPAETVTQRK